jgi:putative ABC transport system permease protein
VTSWPNFIDWREATTTLDGLATVLPTRYTLTGAGEPEEVTGATVSRGFFELVGHRLAFGRPFRDTEIEGEVRNAVVLSQELFTRRFGADPSIVGRTIELDDVTYEVVGVTRPGAGYPRDAELWTPQAFPTDNPLTMFPRRRFLFTVIGRLADAVPLTVAQAEMDAIAARLEEAYPEENRGVGIALEPLHETIVGDVRTPLLVLLGAVAAVLLIAVVNVANLLLARGTARARELAARAALGAGRGRIVRQVLAESALLGGLGGLAGAALAFLGVSVLVAIGPGDLPRLDEVRPDWLILGVALAVALGATLAFGLVPALQASRVDPATNLRKSTRGSSSSALGGVRGAFIAGQFGLALVLLVVSGLLMQSFLNLRAVDSGLETEGVLSLTLDLSPARYPDGEARGAFYRELLDRVTALPGVESLGTITNMFVTDRLVGTPTVESRPDQFGPDTEVPAVSDVVSPGLFSTIGLDIVAGRGLEEADGPDAMRVAVVNETFARSFLAGLDPIGQRFTWLYQGEGSYWFTIVGVVADARRSGPAAPVQPAAFYPLGARPGYHTDMLVRTHGDPLALAPALRDAIHAIDADVPLSRVRTLEQAMADQLAQRRYVSWLLGVFALTALTLAAIGIFGVLAYVVGRRTREIGIRVALGAARLRLLSDVLREGMVHAGAGLLLGVLGSLGVTRLLQSQLFGLEATDPSTFVAASVLLLLVAVLACAVPARRAASVDAVVALREE